MADGLCTAEPRTATNPIEQMPHRLLEVVQQQQQAQLPFIDVGGACAANTTDILAIIQPSPTTATTTNISKPLDITMLDINMPASPADDDCRKKRCVDRYDSSESSDSGVAILSCTDCSGSSTASSDIVDPGSPFSTGSTHSDDSSIQPPKMPPTQSGHHPPWPWVKEVSVDPKQRQAVKRKDSVETTTTTSPTGPAIVTTTEPSPKKKSTSGNVSTCTSSQMVTSSSTSNVTLLSGPISTATELLDASKSFPRLQQGKITEYFKAQFKSNTLLKKELSNIMVKTVSTANPNSKFSGGGQTQGKVEVVVATASTTKKPIPRWRRPQPKVEKPRVRARLVPRKILPAPSNSVISMAPIAASSFPSIITTLIPNMYAIQSKTPTNKPNEASNASSGNQGAGGGGPGATPQRAGSIFVPQFALNDKLNAIPIVTRGAQPLSIIQPLQKVTAINNFVKLNAMPTILKLNTNVIATAMPTVTTAMMPAIRGLASPAGNTTVLPTMPPLEANHEAVVCSPVGRQELKLDHDKEPVMNKHKAGEEEDDEDEDDEDEDDEEEEDEEDEEEEVRQTTRIQLPEELSPADSGVSSSLEVQIIDEDLLKADNCQKSPILSQPKTIRFPAKERVVLPTKEKLPVRADRAACQWDQCAAHFDTNGALLEHLQVKHVISQASQEQYVCLWHGCKVHGRKSCSRTWLERHVLAHAGSKPFRCIVDGCGLRFNSQLALERHVNGHFSSDSTQHANPKKSVENPSAKLLKRNGKKIRFRRQPWSARMFDFIDAGMMEGLQHRLLTMTEKRTNGRFDSTDGQTVTLSSQILAKRVEVDGTRKFLLRWHPNDIVDDEWILENDYKTTQTVQIPRLQPNAKDNLRPILFPRSCNYRNSQAMSCSSPAKHRRKPSKTNT